MPGKHRQLTTRPLADGATTEQPAADGPADAPARSCRADGTATACCGRMHARRNMHRYRQSGQDKQEQRRAGPCVPNRSVDDQEAKRSPAPGRRAADDRSCDHTVFGNSRRRITNATVIPVPQTAIITVTR